MKILAFVFVVCGFSVGAQATTTRCNGTSVSLSGGSIMMSCSRGSCHGWFNSDYYSVSDRCDSNVTFSASGSKGSEYVSGTCRNGWLSAWLPSVSISFRGTCSDGSMYSGDVYRSSISLSGSCREDGSATVFVSSQYERLDGSCY